MTDTRTQLRRVKLFVRACFWLGVLVSLAANVLHADNNIISQVVAAWAPLALLLTVELLTWVPMSVRSPRSWLRIACTAIVAGIAAWVSYWHMVGVAIEYGEEGYTPYLLPISVDGLVVIASITLVEISHRLQALTQTTQDTRSATPQPASSATTSTTTAVPPATPAPTSAPPTKPVTIPAETLAAIAADRKPTPNGSHVQESLL